MPSFPAAASTLSARLCSALSAISRPIRPFVILHQPMPWKFLRRICDFTHRGILHYAYAITILTSRGQLFRGRWPKKLHVKNILR